MWQKKKRISHLDSEKCAPKLEIGWVEKFAWINSDHYTTVLEPKNAPKRYISRMDTRARELANERKRDGACVCVCEVDVINSASSCKQLSFGLYLSHFWKHNIRYTKVKANSFFCLCQESLSLCSAAASVTVIICALETMAKENVRTIVGWQCKYTPKRQVQDETIT